MAAFCTLGLGGMGNLNRALHPRLVQTLFLLLSCILGLSLGTELSFVTCGSVVKLMNIKHNVRLHSHDVRYGSGEFTLVNRLLDVNKPQMVFSLTGTSHTNISLCK